MITETRMTMDGLEHEVRETVAIEWRRYVRESREQDPDLDLDTLREEFSDGYLNEIVDSCVPIRNSNILYAASSDPHVATTVSEVDGHGYDPLTQIRVNIEERLREAAWGVPLD
jgi:hypothetical protein